MGKPTRFAVLAFILVCCLPTYGQQFTQLSGTVTDPTGAVVPNTNLVLENGDRGIRREDVSDSSGRFTFPQVQPGKYKLTAKAPGFNEVIVNAIELLVNTPATINVTFEKVGAVAETISVSAEAVQVNTTDASIGNAIGNQAIMQLPLFARNVAGLLGLQPGVTNFGTDPSTDSRNGAVNGGKSDQANVTLDGVDSNDQQYRYAFTSVLRVTLDSVQEFRTTTANAGAEMGRTSGAQIALVTKSGSNEYHGSMYEYHRNTLTAANSFFRNSAGVPRAALLINVFGASVGGPIKKNKTFFFLNYEGRRDASAASVLRTVPSDQMKQGIIQYRRTDGSIASLTPADIKTRIDPAGIGVNQASLDLFKTYPTANDFTTGDNLNILGYRFNAPQRAKQDTYIARFDHAISAKHTLFARGNLQNDHSSGIPQYPGDPPASVALDNTKGLAVGWNAVITPSLISTTRYGFTRQGFENTGIQNQSAVTFRNLASRYALTKGLSAKIPVHNITQDFAWTHGSHDVRVGGTLRFITVDRANFANSFNAATTNVSWLRGTGTDLQPSDLNSTFRTAYGDAMAAMLGIVTQGTGFYNYDVKGNVQATGSPVLRKFGAEEYEAYAQDTWRVTRALTVTYGIRYSLMPPVYEKNGVQTSANISLGDWFNNRGALAQQGKSQLEAGRISYVLASDPKGRPLYDFHKKNFAPRLSLAYSPQSSGNWISKLTGGPGKTAIRAGWGMYYDLFGQSLIRTFDASAFGLSSNLTNPSGQITTSTAPRFTGFYNVPASVIRPAPKGGFPAEQPDNFAITNSIDDRLKPPYNMNMNFSIGREFKGGLFVQGSYVGRLSRRSLINRDLAMPTDFKDPASGMTYFQAAQQIQSLIRAKAPTSAVGKIPFWENVWGNVAGGGLTATQAVYNAFRLYGPDATSGLADLDEYDDPGCSRLGCNIMFSSQFSALSAWSSIAGGDYHAMQWTARKRFGSGLTLDFNYTFGKSIDLASGTENVASFGGGFMVNPWSPGQRKGVSDYDTTHIVNAFAVWELPFGTGKRVAGNSGKALNSIIGGWQLTPIYSQSSGLPISVGNGRNWPTNWNITGNATQIGVVPTPVQTKNAPAVVGQGGPNVFADPKVALAAYDFTYPGFSGQRNGIRGDGAFRIDLGLAKRFVMPYSEHHSVQFRWETFNLTNTVRFDVNSLTIDLGNTGAFGKYSATLGSARQMQFALRYEF